MKKLLALVFALAFSFPALADQSSYQIPLTGPKAFGGTGGVADEISHAFLAAVGCSSGTASPANGPSSAPILGQCWANTTSSPNQVNIYDGANWNPLFQIDPTNHLNTLTTARAVIGDTTTNQFNRALEVHQSGVQVRIAVAAWANDGANVAGFQGSKSRNYTIGAQGAVVDGDILVFMQGYGSDGTGFVAGGQINVTAEGPPTTGHVPGRMILLTSSTTAVNVERLRIDSTGQIIVNQLNTAGALGGNVSGLIRSASFGNNYSLSAEDYSNDTAGAFIQLFKSRGTSFNALAAVANNDTVGQIDFNATEGTFNTGVASIRALVDGTVTGGNRVPGRLAFYTEGGGPPAAERLRIDTKGYITTGGVANQSISQFEINDADPTNTPNNVAINNWMNAPHPGGMIFSHSTSGTIGTQAITFNGAAVMQITALGSDGTAFRNLVNITGAVDGAPAANSMPGRLTFSTTPSGSTTLAERLRIDSNGYVTIGAAGAANTFGSMLEIVQDPTVNVHADFITVGANISGANLFFLKTRATVPGTQTIVVNGDTLGGLSFRGSDGAAFRQAANISAVVDGTPGAGSMPGRLMFFTTPSGSTTATERLRIDSTGHSLFTAGSPNPASGVNTFAVVTTQAFGGGYGWVDNSGVWGEWTSSSGSQLNIGFAANGSTALTTTAFFQNTTALSLTPPGSSIDMGINIGQSGHGTVSAANCTDALDAIYALNCIDVSSDDINVPSATANGVAILAIVNKWGGSNAHGERSPLYVSSIMTASDATTSNPDGSNNQAATFVSQTSVNIGGGLGTERGTNEPLNPKCIMKSGATHWSVCGGAEVDIEVDTGASVAVKHGWFVLGLAADAVQGSQYDTAYHFASLGVGWKCGFCASDLFSTVSPISSGGTFIGTQFINHSTYSITNGVDLRGFVFSTYAFASGNSSTGFVVNQAGDVVAHSYSLVSGGVQTSGVSCAAGTVNASTVAFTNGIVTHC